MTDEELLKKGIAGKVFVVIKSAYALGDQNDFAGTSRKGKKYAKNIIYSKGGKDGAYWKLDENGATFKGLRDMAKKALPSLKDEKYTEAVKDLIDGFASFGSGGGGKGKRGVNTAALEGLTL